MNARMVVACLAGGLLLLAPGNVAAGDQDTTDFRRWGIGWDDGIAVRHHFSPSWGIGLQIKPGIRDHDSETEFTRPDPQYDYDDVYTEERSSIMIGAMAFRQAQLGKWLGIGPYCRVYYEHESSERYRYNTGSSSWVTSDVKTDVISIEVGIRPTFRFDERLVLETRFGIGLSNQWIGAEDRSLSGGQFNTKSQDADATTFTTFGQDLGPGSVLQFIIYF